MPRTRLCLLLLVSSTLIGWSERTPILVEVSLADGTFQASDIRRGSAGATISAQVAVGSPRFPTPPGHYSPRRLILNPQWQPGAFARSNGAQSMPASGATPLGIATIPLAHRGLISLHGGATPLVLGKPVSLGCIRMADADLAAFVRWLGESGALFPPRPQPNGEIIRAFSRAVRVTVR